jgi:hypothetical protein
VLHRIYWIAWLAGTALILLSWFHVVEPLVGWVGFLIACVASFVSYLPHRSEQGAVQDWAVLTRAMIDSKDHGYDVAMDGLRKGNAIFYDGLVVASTTREIVLTVMPSFPVAELDEVRAQQDAERARAAFETLTRLAPEAAAFAEGKDVRVHLISEFGPKGFVICQVAHGQVEWKVRGKGTERP